MFYYTPVDQIADYIPPDVGAGTNKTVYTYNFDKDLTNITHPDGQGLGFNYNSAAQLTNLSLTPANQILDSYAYDATTGKLATITTADGGTLSYTYNGSLLTQTAWAGAVAGSVGRTYDSDFRVASLALNGANSITFQYDADGMLTKAGDLSLSRNAHNELLTGTTLGSVTDSLTYNGFGEVAAYNAKFNTSELLAEQFVSKLGALLARLRRLVVQPTPSTIAMTLQSA